jgi:hypothetical protein
VTQISVEEMKERVRAEVSMPSRLGHTALMVAGLGMAALSTSLLLTEPALPGRAQAAFVTMTLAGVAWAAFAGWVLARRRVLFGRQQIVAARLAVAITVVFVAGSIAIRERTGSGAVITAAAMCAAAIAMLWHAHRRVALLSERRRVLESGQS